MSNLLIGGGFSQVKCELFLLNEATKTEHLYYHLISGVDLPLKSQQYIHNFFKTNANKEFVSFQSSPVKKEFRSRVEYYHIFNDIAVLDLRNNKLIRLLNRIFLSLQKKLKIHRWKEGYDIQKGTNWFSITHKLAKYILSKTDWIYKHFKYTHCADEIFLHTIINNSDYKNKLYITDYNDDPHGSMRYIDWKRGNPYVFRKEDFNRLMSSNCIFARKFSEEVDKEIITMVANALLNINQN